MIKNNNNIIQKNGKNSEIDLDLLDPTLLDQDEIIDYDYKNPFFIPVEGSELKFTKNKFLADSYKHVYILCLADNFETIEKNIKQY